MDVSKATFADEAIRECGTHACGRLRRLHRGEEGDKKRVVCVCDPAETADKDSGAMAFVVSPRPPSKKDKGQSRGHLQHVPIHPSGAPSDIISEVWVWV